MGTVGEPRPFTVHVPDGVLQDLGYYGDTVLNSVGDVLAAVLGCVLAAWLPAGLLVLGIVLLEGILAVWIRDNLTLNVLMLLRPIEAIRRWQLGG